MPTKEQLKPAAKAISAIEGIGFGMAHFDREDQRDLQEARRLLYKVLNRNGHTISKFGTATMRQMTDQEKAEIS